MCDGVEDNIITVPSNIKDIQTIGEENEIRYQSCYGTISYVWEATYLQIEGYQNKIKQDRDIRPNSVCKY